MNGWLAAADLQWTPPGDAVLCAQARFAGVPFDVGFVGVLSSKEGDGLEVLATVVLDGDLPAGKPNVEVLAAERRWPAVVDEGCLGKGFRDGAEQCSFGDPSLADAGYLQCVP